MQGGMGRPSARGQRQHKEGMLSLHGSQLQHEICQEMPAQQPGHGPPAPRQELEE